MENHPIPQDVTSFQFKLIGNMTVKQFAYLAAGAIVGWIFFSLPLNRFLTYPFVFLSVTFGFSLAFLPVDGRPMDNMLLNFIKALFAPNQYLFQKSGRQILQLNAIKKQAVQQSVEQSVSQEQLHTLLNQLPQTPKNTLDEKELAFFQSIFTNPSLPSQQLPPIPSERPKEKQYADQPPFETKQNKTEKLTASTPQQTTIPSQVPQNNIPIIAQKVTVMTLESSQDQQKPILPVQPRMNTAVASQQHSTEQPTPLEQKQTLPQQTQPAQQKIIAPTNITAPATSTPVIPIKRDLPQKPLFVGNSQKQAGVPFIPDVPDLIVGIVKNPRGNILPNILIEVKDKEGNPVRAFKTNALGQFASATPLASGTYTIEFEDPKGENKFEAIDLTVNGQILKPMEIVSQDQREMLRKALFAKV